MKIKKHKNFSGCLNDIHREKLCYTKFNTKKAASLFLTFFICLHNKLSSMHITYYRVQMFENV